MSLPHKIGWEDVKAALPINYVCCVCGGPLLHAVNTACPHRICSTCFKSEKIKKSVKPCNVCGGKRNLKVDGPLSSCVQQEVRQALLSKGCALLQADFPTLPQAALLEHAPRFLNANALLFNLTRFREELHNLDLCISRSLIDPCEMEGKWCQIATVTSRYELDVMAGKARVMVCTVVGE